MYGTSSKSVNLQQCLNVCMAPVAKRVNLQQCLNVCMVPVAKQLPYNSV